MSDSNQNQLFASIIEKLLAGDIICIITAEELYQHLEDPMNQQDVDSYLRRIGRVLLSTQDQSGYYAAYQDISDLSAKNQIRRQFSEAINDLEPLVRWLRLASSAEKSGAPLQPGDLLRGSELLEAIENAPALIEELDRLSRSRLFNNSSKGPKKQLDAILKKLCDQQYLINRGSSGSLFVATAKWARLYEILQFIAAHEQLDEAEDQPEQEELFH